ncbi:DgyrCDS6146 [Dimorphilus gyrociliatus]|uniref:DgyrCDS6146 n=1 Tax=Dimorphilus gyrociliatus TaxID=2664684 RepID=A0A7I8VRZ2_9ANNE|nr:DgyrCDS6146 [Dimorphilus gyrociliatus]
MPFSCLKDMERAINAALNQALIYERSSKWEKVVQSYRRLLRMLYDIPIEIQPDFMKTLLYECEYHLGVALQNGGEHLKSLKHFTNSIHAIFLPKNGCAAGCGANSCLITPLYARRATAYAKLNDIRSALKDAERAVVLDCCNPDVYCVRAMVHASKDEFSRSVRDINMALKYDSKHLCALMLKGALKKRNMMSDSSDDSEHRLALNINPDASRFFNVCSFKHKDAMAFFEKFLYALGVPHTISKVQFDDDVALDFGKRRVQSADSYESPMKFQQPKPVLIQPVRCGTFTDFRDGSEKTRRRYQYGEAVRQCTMKPKTAEQFLDMLEKASTVSSMKYSFGSTSSNRSVISAFERSVNLDDIPRMYSKPWSGDALPAGEKVTRPDSIRIPFKT